MTSKFDPHKWRPLTDETRECDVCGREETRPGGAGVPHYRGGINYARMLKYFVGPCVGTSVMRANYVPEQK